MGSSSRIDSAVFQLTPTRTRCDLFVTLNGLKVKVASGLVDPFVAHLKTAQAQMSKGGYSIILEPEPGNEALWFTKGTIERFVRFVSTPEVLERVHSLELELQQIDETIAMQNNSSVEGPPEKTKPANFTEVCRISQTDHNDEKGIIIYEPGANPTETTETAEDEENSKIQLMKVLESRKVMLQKEQGMAFARAMAAEFNIEHIGQLLSFSETFGAQRLRDACIKFLELWNRKHETGQWVDFDESEAMTSRSEFLIMNSSNIIASNNVMNWHEMTENGKSDAESIERKQTTDQQAAFFHPENYHGKYPHPMFSPWPVNSPAYPMQGIPYYQNYHGNGSYYNPQFSTGEIPKMRRRRHSMDAEIIDDGGELWETRASRVPSQDDGDVNRRRGKKKSVVQESASGSEDDINASLPWKRSNKSSSRSNYEDSAERAVPRKDEKGAGQWDAFQTFLLKDAEEADNRSMLALEKSKRKPEDHMDQTKYSDDFINNATRKSSPDPLVMDRIGREMENTSSKTMKGASLLVGRKQNSLDCANSGQEYAVGMESELKFEGKVSGGQSIYEAGTISLMPKRKMKKETAGYDPALDIVGQALSTKHAKSVKPETTERKSKMMNIEAKANSTPKSSDIKKSIRPVIKGRSSKLNSLDEAKSRAEKLRKFKADLQILKKEKEEEKRKRLESLKLERQKRIAARSGSVSSTNASQQKRNSLPAKLSPSVHDKSKLGDSAPRFSAAASQQKRKSLPGKLSHVINGRPKVRDSATKSSSPLPNSAVKTLPSMLKRSVSANGSRLSKSVSSLPKARAMKGDNRASMPLLRRLSEPKLSEGRTVSSVKVKKAELPAEKNLSRAPDKKKMSAILSHDKNKAATLPELKVKTAKVNDVGDDNTSIEKTVAMLEPEQPSDPLEHKSVDNGDSVNELHSSGENKMAEAVAVETVEENTTDSKKTEADNLSSEKPCVVPSEASLTDQNTRNVQIPTTSVQISTTRRAHTNGTQSSKLEKIPEYVEKDKESFKGLRKFLKFGRKNHNSDHIYETDKSNKIVSEADDLSANSSEANKLKNLISREEGASQNQSSRHFSLLSPFRSKTTEKESA